MKTKSVKVTHKFVPQQVNPLVSAMANVNNVTFTENGAKTNKSTLSSVLDWFGAGGALRTRSEEDIIKIFSKAFSEDALVTLKVLFYFRDIREGQGERRTFRVILKWLANNYTNILEKNLKNIAFFGRYDDYYTLVDTPLEAKAFELIEHQLKEDLKNLKDKKPVSLLAKWLKSINASSLGTKKLGYKTCKALKLSPAKYRKILSKLRAYINVLEVKMCSNNWAEIDYEKVPSQASNRYKKAFGKHDTNRYKEYLTSVEKGEAKMNAGSIYPYEILRSLINSHPGASEIKSADLQWKAMPNWLDGNDHHGIVVADVSGSMSGLPILVSVSLALYFAERNVGPFKDYWINFSSSPTFQKFVGNNIYEKYNNMDKHNWSQSTNLQAAFDLILNTAVKNKIKQKDMPSALYIVSDMEFDDAGEDTNYDVIKQKYENAGYKLPKLIWWNVNARNDQTPIKYDDKGTALVSGCSPAIFKTLMSAKSFDPMSIVMDVVNKERYNSVTI